MVLGVGGGGEETGALEEREFVAVEKAEVAELQMGDDEQGHEG